LKDNEDESGDDDEEEGTLENYEDILQ